MPLSSRSKKSRKDGADRAPTVSVLSMNSHSTSKSSQSSVGKSKNEALPLQPAMSKSNVIAGGKTPKSQAALDPKAKRNTDLERKTPNVFEYLDDDDDDDGSSESSDISSEEDNGPHPAPTTSTQSKAPAYSAPERTAGSSTNAESGRSRASSIWSKNSLDSHPLSTTETSPSSAPSQLARSTTTRKASMDTSYGTVGSLVSGSLLSTSSHPRKQSLDFTTMPEARKSRSSHVPSGYGLLAWRLSSSTTDTKEPQLPPLYRRFEDLNHRVLLHLQDEIAQMEEDLRVLDDYEEMHRVATAEQEGSKKMPASRRMDVQAQVYSSLHYRREEVMGQLTHKIERYILQTLPSAADQDVATYRTWMRKHTPIIAAETRFLDHPKDLVSLTPPPPAAPPMITPVYSAIIIASAAIILPLLAFSMISEFSGRILLVAIVGGAASAIASNYSPAAEGLVGSQDGWRCASLYFGFMAVAAMFIP
ncbi:hypothetical protein BDV59DRAFT_84758 [Aspergillus ambiguus]|uniref:uncharacterized protein n=1 Tax=Aspergillus ambiguus TaxID=176160 RepID=UPI003CCE4F36